MSRLTLSLMAVIVAAGCQEARTPTAPDRDARLPAEVGRAPSAHLIPGQYIVVLRPAAQDVSTIARDLLAAHGGTLRFTYTHALQGFSAELSDAAAAALARHPLVAYVEQNQMMHAVADQPNATWGLDRVDQHDLPLNQLYSYNATGVGVKVYIIDTGIRQTHSDFGGRALPGVDEVGDGHGTDDCNGHGTHVSGTVGGNTYGVAKAVTLVAVRVLDCSGSGSSDGVIAGVDWVTGDHQAGDPAAANMSLGGFFDQALNDAVKNGIADGVTYAVAAGNSSFDACFFSPSSAPDALTVAASDQTDARAGFSNYGSCVDLYGPGVSITSDWNSSDAATNTISGTSMASPHVTGGAALYLQGHPSALPAEVGQAIKNAATPSKITGNPSGTPNLLLYTKDFSAGPPPAPPADPSSLTATAVSSTQINLAWTDNSNNEDGFKIERCTGAGCTTFGEITSVGAGVTAYNNTGLSVSTTYRYRVRAFNSGGNSGYSNESEATTFPPPPAPNPPSDLTAAAVSYSRINLAWIDNSDNEVGFRILRCQGAGCFDFGAVAAVGPNTTDYSDIGLTENTIYRYQIEAFNASGSAYSNVAEATTPLSNPPTARYTWTCGQPGGKGCRFTSTSIDDGGITSTTWNFGDGATGTGTPVNHVFKTPGTYTVQVTVRDAGGQTSTRACTVTTGTSGSCQP